MSGHDKRGIDQPGPMQNDRTVVSLQDWRANKIASLETRSAFAADIGACASASTAISELCALPPNYPTEIESESFAANDAQKPSPKCFDPTLMPEPSARMKRFMEVMSGSEDDPAFAVDVIMFFWSFSRCGMPMPKRALALLERHAAAGDPACILVRDWLRKKMVSTGKRPLWVFEGGKA